MDIVHHSLIGGSGFLIASSVDQPLAGAAFLMANISPDLDVAFITFGKRFYLRNHQSITHSLISVFCLNSMNLELFWFMVIVILEPIKVFLIVYHIIKGPYIGVLSKSL